MNHKIYSLERERAARDLMWEPRSELKEIRIKGQIFSGQELTQLSFQHMKGSTFRQFLFLKTITNESCCKCDSLGPGSTPKRRLNLEILSMWLQLQSCEKYTNNGVMEYSSIIKKSHWTQAICGWKGPERARGSEKPLHKAEKVESGLH